MVSLFSLDHEKRLHCCWWRTDLPFNVRPVDHVVILVYGRIVDCLWRYSWWCGVSSPRQRFAGACFVWRCHRSCMWAAAVLLVKIAVNRPPCSARQWLGRDCLPPCHT